jgi:O-antigen ligase
MSAMGWVMGLWCLAFVVMGAFQKPTPKLSSVWALGLMFFVLVQSTISYGMTGFIVSFVIGLFFLFVGSSKYGLR